MPELSVIIVSYNVRDLLRECLRSVYSSANTDPERPIALEVWVVDNASADGSAAMVRQEFPQAKLIANATNSGFARANNQALRECGGQKVCLLNPDTVVRDGALRKMIEYLDAHPDVGAVGPKLLYADGSLQHSAFRFPNLWMSLFDFFPINHRVVDSRLNGRYPLQSYSAPFAIDHPLGACILARRELFDQVGLLDEEFFMYCEEVDWCIRVRRAGWEIYCVPDAEVVHYAGQSTRQFRGAMLIELHRSRRRLFGKHYSPGFQWASRQIVRLGLLREGLRTYWRAALGKLAGNERDERLATYWQIFRM